MDMGSGGVTGLTGRNGGGTGGLIGLASRPSGFLTAVRVTVALTNFLNSTFTTSGFTNPVIRTVLGAKMGVPANALGDVVIVSVALLLSFFAVVFNRLIPGQVTVHGTRGITLNVSKLVCIVSVVFGPVI